MTQSPITLDHEKYASMVLVTGIMIWLKYAYMTLAGTVTQAMENPKQAQVRWAQRAFGNYNEHFSIFLASLWLHAVFMSPYHATILGYALIGLRVLYPVLWAVGGTAQLPDYVKVVTTLGYGIVLYLTCSTVLKVYGGYDVNGWLESGASAMLMPKTLGPLLLGPLAGVVPFLVSAGLATGVNLLIADHFAEDEPEQIQVLQEQFDEQLPLIQKHEQKYKNPGCCG